MKQELNFELYAGDSVTLDIDATNPDGTPFDLAGTTITWTASDQYGLQAVEYTVGSGITVTNAAAGLLSVNLARGAITKAGIWKHQLEIVQNDISNTPVDGYITVKRSLRPLT